ncbi:PREDICTED: uncharacterized protein LOC109339966 [Lupinus angustifolius]|uniref:uncharacterized protein LOC109339966 n=1 Tax=Lupinus angustifolius TaxID=3871 RepID=UPI00092F5170|nr:PREDICTED: uncharacterized protein LOC109339966 [Lupinus angustifolius]
MDSYSSSILPSSPPHRLVNAYPNVNIFNSFQNHPTSPTTLAPPPPCNDDHPSYSKMICSAIRALKDENGSSKMTIGKYIAQEYNDLLPPITTPSARSDKPMSLSLSSSSFVWRGHDCLPKRNPDSKSTPQLEQNVEPKSTKLGLNDDGEFSSSVAGTTTEVIKTSQSCSLKVFGEGEGVSSTLRLENGKKVRRPPTKYQSFLSVDIISDDHEQKPRRPLKAHLKPIVVPSTARSNDGGVPPPADAHELSQLPSNSVPIGSPKP